MGQNAGVGRNDVAEEGIVGIVVLADPKLGVQHVDQHEDQKYHLKDKHNQAEEEDFRFLPEEEAFEDAVLSI